VIYPPDYLYRASVSYVDGSEDYAVCDSYASALRLLEERFQDRNTVGPMRMHMYVLAKERVKQ
jgi:hypothetical protein